MLPHFCHISEKYDDDKSNLSGLDLVNLNKPQPRPTSPGPSALRQPVQLPQLPMPPPSVPPLGLSKHRGWHKRFPDMGTSPHIEPPNPKILLKTEKPTEISIGK